MWWALSLRFVVLMFLSVSFVLFLHYCPFLYRRSLLPPKAFESWILTTIAPRLHYTCMYGFLSITWCTSTLLKDENASILRLLPFCIVMSTIKLSKLLLLHARYSRKVLSSPLTQQGAQTQFCLRSVLGQREVASVFWTRWLSTRICQV